MKNKDAYIGHLENTIKDLQNQVSNFTEMVLLLRKEKNHLCEKTVKQTEGQLSLFNEAEIEADSEAAEPIILRKGGFVHRKKDRLRRTVKRPSG